ncbi:glutaredoxin family protein [Halobacillus litoralis]|uniref:Glutaredoxin family protein n=1 Tax=Halobacillus litoralis TaxID=45668 RepID=A0A845EJ94_9BACI|nr:glutaredoxin family protein [Halobacillus litoralis]MYL51258.1 glutaredoxin family protein [Halobacillus litoralis]
MGNPEVIVYTSRNCHYCEKVLGTLEDWEIDYEERNVSENRDHFRELQRNNIYGTPAVFIDGEKILGYQERKMKQKLRIKENPQYIRTDSMNFS